VFNTILGIPAHPLLIHAAVIFIPLLIVGAIVYAAWPPFHSRIGWAVLALAIVAPFSALFAKLSGQDLRNRLIARHEVSPKGLAQITQHNSYGNHTFWWTIGLGVATLLVLGYYWQLSRTAPAPDGDATTTAGIAAAAPAVFRIGATVVTLVLGVIVGYYVFKTGDTGAHIVWTGL
jgi:hypothetical protein